MHDKTLLGFQVHLIDMEGATSLADKFVRSGDAHRIVTLNPEMMIRSRRSPALRMALSGADAYLPETAGMSWALGTQKVPGIEFMYRLLGLAAENDYSVYFLGAKEGVAKKAAEQARALFPRLNIVGTRHGFFDPEEERIIVNEINAKDPDLLFVAMGAIPQETFIHRNKQLLKARIVMGVGGSLDVLSGSVARAPKFFCDHGLEWLYRLITQPQRLWRMAGTLPKFVFLVWKERLDAIVSER